MAISPDFQNILNQLLQQQLAVSDPLLAEQSKTANEQVLANLAKAGIRTSGVGQELLRRQGQEATRQRSSLVGGLSSQNLQAMLQELAAQQAFQRQKELLQFQKQLSTPDRQKFGLGSLVSAFAPVAGAGLGFALGGGLPGAGLGAQLGASLGGNLAQGLGPPSQIVPDMSGAAGAFSNYAQSQQMANLMNQIYGPKKSSPMTPGELGSFGTQVSPQPGGQRKAFDPFQMSSGGYSQAALLKALGGG